PDQRAPDKIRREQQGELMLRLVRNPDLLAELSSEPGLSGLYRLGFAAEDSGLAVAALAKLQRKHLDAIVANDIRRSDIGFGSDHNEGLMLFADGQRLDLPKMPKSEMAERILGAVRPRLG
ncbi:MAG: phosphopantothenoylcysteine decarboxylase, partial [Candidatus Dormibacteraceae bacterium]